MSKRQIAVNFLVCLLGGMISAFFWTSLMAPAAHADSPQTVLYDQSGKLRLQLGLYNSGAEKGQPSAVLYDKDGNVKLLLRLAGDNDAPVLVMKDKEHRDRIVMGLALNGPGEDPFFVYYDADGTKHPMLGNF